jgi:hypothetical protein
VNPGARNAYLACTALLTLVGAGVTSAAGGPVAEVALGAGTAWGLQAVATWILAAGLARGEGVTGRWAAGLALRVSGVGAVLVLAPPLGADRKAAAVAYGAAMVAFLLGEAAWLWWMSSRTA